VPYFIWLILLLFATFGQSTYGGGDSYYLHQSTLDKFEAGEDGAFLEISSVDDLYAYLQTTFIESMSSTGDTGTVIFLLLLKKTQEN
jgi:hypothetical protein